MSYKGSGKKFMDVVTYTGTNVARDIGGLEFSPDFVWIKSRSAADSHYLFDTVRGAGAGLFTNSSAAETTYTNLLTSFNDDGFGLGDGNDTNTNTDTYVAWCWDAGDTTEEIAAGSLNSSIYNIQNWLGGFTVSSSTIYNAIGAFDGNEATYASGQVNDSQLVVTAPSPITNVTKVEVHRPGGLSSPNNTAQVNDGDQVAFGESVWTTAYEGGPITFTSLTIQGSSGDTPFLGVVKINGVILLDETAESVTTVASYPSIPSTVRANQDAGFSVVKYTGTGSPCEIAHGLGNIPKFIIIKGIDVSDSWHVYHQDVFPKYLRLNTTDSEVTNVNVYPSEPSNIVFYTGNDAGVNANNSNYITYCWSEVPGFSKFGSYVGGGNPLIYTGFKPEFLMVKRTDSAGNWVMLDATRSTNNPRNDGLEANNSNVEYTAGQVNVNFTSNGFQIAGSDINTGNFIYAAFAEQPFGKASKKRLEFSSTQDFKEILNQDVLTQYPSTTASATVESVDVDNASIEVYTDGISDNFLPNTNQTFTKPVTDPSNKRWTWTAWVKRSELSTTQKILTTTDSGFNIEFDTNNKLVVGGGVPFSYYYYVGTPSNLEDVLTNGVPYTGQNIATNQNLVMVRNGSPEIRSGNTFRTAGGFFFGLDASRPGGYYTADGNRLGGAGTYNEPNWLDMFNTTRDQEDSYDQSYAIYTNSQVAYILMGNYNNTSAQPGELTPAGLLTTETYTDPGAWMHILVSCDTISGEGYKLYVNGDEVTDFDSQVQPDADSATTVNTTSVEQFIGADVYGYIADVQFVDGQALTPSDFTYDNTSTREGQLYPLRYDGWYGTRGYRLPMEGQTFETSEITNVANVLEEANAETGGTWTLIEGTATSYEDGNPMNSWSNVFDGNTSTNSFFAYGGTGGQSSRYRYTFPEPIPFTSLQAWCSAYSSAQINLLSFNGGDRRQGGSGGTSALVDFTSITPGSKLEYLEIGTDGYNYGLIAQIIIDGVPLGVTYEVNRTLLTLTDNTNLSTFSVGDSVIQGGTVSAPTPAFSATLYTGNGSARTITNGIDLAGEGGMTWIKSRTSNNDHNIFDTINILQGPGRALLPNGTFGLQVYGSNSVTGFNNNGFSIGGDHPNVNELGLDYASWSFRKAPGFFDVLTYTGDGVPARQISHNLGSVPGCIIVKRTDSTGNWAVYHRSLPNDANGVESESLILNLTSDSGGYGFLNTHANQTSTYFTIKGNSAGDWNINGATYVAYIFAHNESDDQGVIKCGSYTGTGSAGNDINIGFEPQFVITKNSTSTNDWFMYDNMRIDSSGNQKRLNPDTNAAELTTTDTGMKFNATGFTPIGNNNNKSGETFIYIAIAEDAMASSEVTPEGILEAINPSVPSLSVSSVLSGWSAGETVEVTGKYITDLHDQNQFTWTKYNINSTDAMVDTPNNYGEENGLGGEVRGNYATLNPLDASPNTISTSNGNLQFTASNDFNAIRATQYITEKTYWETEVPTGGTYGTTYYLTGMVPNDVTLVSDGSSRIGYSTVYGKSVSVYPANLNMWYNATTSISIDTISPGDVIGHTYDPTTGEYSAYVNGVIIGTFTVDSSLQYHPTLMNADASNICKINFGATPFAYPAPAGYKTLNTTNAGDPLIIQGNTQMDIVTYTGTSADHTISGLNFSPDLVWIKSRSTSGTNHALIDTVRGGDKILKSNLANDEVTDEYISSFTSDGFTLSTSDTEVNSDGSEYVAWCWNAGTNAPALNTSGTIASTVKSNPLSGFSITTWTGTSTTGSVGHGLGVAPDLIIIKCTSFAYNWYVYTSEDKGGAFLHWNSTGSYTTGTDATNGGSATSSIIPLGGSGQAYYDEVNESGKEYIAYSWASVPGYSKFGVYNITSTDEKFIHCGFKPRWVMIKGYSMTSDWMIFDLTRSPYNDVDLILKSNTTNAEITQSGDANKFQIYDNGFVVNDVFGTSSGSFLYMAFADMPTQYFPQ